MFIPLSWNSTADPDVLRSDTVAVKDYPIYFVAIRLDGEGRMSRNIRQAQGWSPQDGAVPQPLISVADDDARLLELADDPTRAAFGVSIPGFPGVWTVRPYREVGLA